MVFSLLFLGDMMEFLTAGVYGRAFLYHGGSGSPHGLIFMARIFHVGIKVLKVSQPAKTIPPTGNKFSKR